MVLKLYSVSDGPPSLAVRMALKYLGLDFKLIDVDFVGGYHMTDEYSKMNPQKEIPVLDDDGFFLSERYRIRTEIMQYFSTWPIAMRRMAPFTLRIQKQELLSIIDWLLIFTYYRNIGEHVMLPIFFGYERTPLSLKKVHMGLAVYNTYLERLNKKYTADDKLTIADLQLVTATICLEAIGFDISPCFKVAEWYARFKAENPLIWAISEKGMKEIESFNKNPPDLSHLNHPIHSFRKVKSN